MGLRHVRSVPPTRVRARCSAFARSAVNRGRVGLAATALLLVPGLATATVAHAAKATGPVVVRVPLRTPGVYEVRVTVASTVKNHVDLKLGSMQGHIATASITTSRGHQ